MVRDPLPSPSPRIAPTLLSLSFPPSSGGNYSLTWQYAAPSATPSASVTPSHTPSPSVTPYPAGCEVSSSTSTLPLVTDDLPIECSPTAWFNQAPLLSFSWLDPAALADTATAFTTTVTLRFAFGFVCMSGESLTVALNGAEIAVLYPAEFCYQAECTPVYDTLVTLDATAAYTSTFVPGVNNTVTFATSWYNVVGLIRSAETDNAFMSVGIRKVRGVGWGGTV